MSTQNDDVTNLGNSAKGASDEVTKLTQMLAVLSGKSFVDLQDKINRNVKSQSELLREHVSLARLTQIRSQFRWRPVRLV